MDYISIKQLFKGYRTTPATKGFTIWLKSHLTTRPMSQVREDPCVTDDM